MAAYIYVVGEYWGEVGIDLLVLEMRINQRSPAVSHDPTSRLEW